MQNTESISNAPKAHPFELAGMGVGPFRFVGIASIPSASLAEHNPDAYNNALRDLPRDLIGGCGTCYNCGMAISNICIIQNAAGQRYGVGCDCVQKTDDPYLGNAAKVALARLQRDQRRERADRQRAAKHQAWLSTVCNEAGETNAQRQERERLEAEAAKAARVQAGISKFGFLVPILKANVRTEGDFCYNMLERIRHGNDISGRPLEIIGDIYAREFGRRGSKGYEAASADFCKRIDAEEVAQ